MEIFFKMFAVSMLQYRCWPLGETKLSSLLFWASTVSIKSGDWATIGNYVNYSNTHIYPAGVFDRLTIFPSPESHASSPPVLCSAFLPRKRPPPPAIEETSERTS